MESIFSTKKVQRKTMRVVIAKIQEQLTNGVISDVIHVTSKNQLGDVFTKKGACTDKILSVIPKGTIEHE